MVSFQYSTKKLVLYTYLHTFHCFCEMLSGPANMLLAQSEIVPHTFLALIIIPGRSLFQEDHYSRKKLSCKHKYSSKKPSCKHTISPVKIVPHMDHVVYHTDHIVKKKLLHMMEILHEMPGLLWRFHICHMICERLSLR